VPTTAALSAFALASLILIALPGPSVLFVVGRSLALGRRGGLLSVIGNELGGLPLVAAVAFGIGTAIAQSAVLFNIIKLIGAAYLVYLGAQAISHRHGPTDALPTGGASPRPLTILGQGFAVGITNPKTIVFFIAALPQFVDIDRNVPMQMLVLGLVFTVIALICDSVWALLAGTVRTWFVKSPGRLSAVQTTGGALTIGLGGWLALSATRLATPSATG